MDSLFVILSLPFRVDVKDSNEQLNRKAGLPKCHESIFN